MSFLVGKPNSKFPSSWIGRKQKSLSFLGGSRAIEHKAVSMKLILLGNPTSADLRFMHSDPFSFPSSSSSSSRSSTRSDAESAPPEFERLFDRICDEYAEWVGRSGRQLPPEWTMPDLVRAVISDERIDPGFLTSAYYDVMLHGPNAWLCNDILTFLDLMNYVF